MKKRILALVLSLLMCVSLVPAAFAADESADSAENTEAAVPCETENTVDTVINIAPDTAVVTVYDADGEVIEAEDGCYKLLPGEYSYSAECEGYAPLVNIPFTVEAGTEPVEISVVMRPEVKISAPVEELLEETESEGENMMDIRVEYESPEHSSADYTITRFEDLRTILTTSPYNQLYIRDDSENGIVISEDISFPAGKTITLTGHYTILENVTVYNDAYLSIIDFGSSLTVRGSMVNNMIVYVPDAEECRLIIDGGSFTGGTVKSYTFNWNENFNISSFAPGLDPEDWDVREENSFYNTYSAEWQYGAGLTRLSAPVNPKWGEYKEMSYNEVTHSVEYRTVVRPGAISFGVDGNYANGYCVTLYMITPDGDMVINRSNHPAYSSAKYTNTDLYDNLFIDGYKDSGSYYFTVQFLGNGTDCRNSAAVKSEVWDYVRPDVELQMPVAEEIVNEDGKLVAVVGLPESIDGIGEIVYNVYYRADEYSYMQRIFGFSSRDLSGRAVIPSNAISSFQSGYLYFTAALIPADCTKYLDSMTSDLSPAYDIGAAAEEFNAALEAIDSTGSPDAIRSEVQALGANNIKYAFESRDERAIQNIQNLEAAVGGAAKVEADSAVEGIDCSAVSIVGANLNTPVNAANDMVLRISKPASVHQLPPGYSKALAITFDMTLENVRDAENLDVPVIVTMPVPETIRPDYMVVLHFCESRGVIETLMPNIRFNPADGKLYMSLVLSEFSKFTITQRGEDPAPTPGDVNNDGKVNLKDAVALLKYVTGEELAVNVQVLDVNGDGENNIKDAVLLLKYVTGEDVKIN